MTKILYHGGCCDGFGAAFIAAMALGLEESDLIAVKYGDEAPFAECEGEDVYILDFSYPRVELLEMLTWARTVVVLDHHASAQKELAGLEAPGLTIEFDMERSGCRMTYDHFQEAAAWGSSTRQRLDLLSRFIQDRDLWQWRLGDSRSVSAFLAALPKTLPVWTQLIHMDWDEIVSGGGAILMHIETQAAELTRESKWCLRTFRATPGVALINICTAAPGSEILGQLAEGRPFAVGWAQSGDGSFYYSLRSRDDGVDVGALAASLRADGTAFAGGGHARAAGFTSTYRPDELFRR